MIFQPTRIQGVFEIDVERIADERGFFGRSWCTREFQGQGLAPELVQCSISFNAKKGTLRGIHYQADPHGEAKLVRCTQGSIFDVAVDLRPDSPTFCQWVGATLTAENRKMLYIPPGCGHAFLTLDENSEVFYQMSEFYHPESARGLRWDDAAFGIKWPELPAVISERDRLYPDFLTK